MHIVVHQSGKFGAVRRTKPLEGKKRRKKWLRAFGLEIPEISFGHCQNIITLSGRRMKLCPHTGFSRTNVIQRYPARTGQLRALHKCESLPRRFALTAAHRFILRRERNSVR